ncbi:MAG: phosphatase PAP2 family protein [Ignavibacteriae bacterium]|nr:phosphatase PAP2 family protein [Ignavibacteriota bacterium]
MLMLDLIIIEYLNQFSQQSLFFDKFIVFLSNNNLLKGGILSFAIWWAWFFNRNSNFGNRILVISNLVGSFIAMATARILAVILPFRHRPIHDDELSFEVPHGMNAFLLEGWSSMPSDHAVLYFTLASGLFFISRIVGFFAIIYTAIIISFPRIYLGLHYPSDIFVGAIIGIAFSYISYKYFVNSKFVKKIFQLSLIKPYIFYPILFLFTYQIADLFDGIRAIGNGFNFFLIVCGEF